VFFKAKQHALDPPEISSNSDAREILRVWVMPEWSKMQVALMTASPKPALWGIALVDIARHVAKAYALNGTCTEDAALAQIKQLFDAEWGSPTDLPEGTLVD